MQKSQHLNIKIFNLSTNLNKVYTINKVGKRITKKTSSAGINWIHEGPGVERKAAAGQFIRYEQKTQAPARKNGTWKWCFEKTNDIQYEHSKRSNRKKTNETVIFGLTKYSLK